MEENNKNKVKTSQLGGKGLGGKELKRRIVLLDDLMEPDTTDRKQKEK